MKKILLTLATTILASSAFAAEVAPSSGPEVKLEGAFDFQAALRQQKKLGEDNMITHNQKNGAFYTQGAVAVDVSNTLDTGLKYGARINLKTSTKEKGTNGSFIYTETDYGRFEAGSNDAAQSNMAVSAYTIAAATGDDFGRYVNLNPKVYTNTKGEKVGSFNGDPDYYDLVTAGYANLSEKTRKINYYTPKISGFQLGVSYTPDTSNTGDSDSMKNSKPLYYTDAATSDSTYTKIVKNLVGVGLTYEYNLSDGFDVKLGAGYEKGSTYAKVQDVKFPVLKFSPHELYNVGAVVTYGNYSIAGSYADAGKSLTNSLDKTKYNMKRQNKLYTAGVAYNQGPVGLSLTYLHNDKYNNKLDAYTLGTQYKIAPGLLQYVEATSFKYSNKGLAVNDGVLSTQSRKLTGMVYILGLKVTF